MRIDVVLDDRGGIHADAVLALWAAHGALVGEAAQRRLAEVVCVLVDDDGTVHGVNSAVPTEVPLIGNRRFWFYRRFLALDTPAEWDAPMLVAAFDALAEHSSGAGAPIGVCTAVDAATSQRNPAAVWPASGMVYAGRTPDGRDLRIRYFEGARIA